MGWKDELDASHSIEHDTPDRLVLRQHWRTAVAFGGALALLTTPLAIAALVVKGGSSFDRIALSALGVVCPLTGAVLALTGFLKRESRIVIDRAVGTISWGVKDTLRFEDVARVLVAPARMKVGEDSRGRTQFGRYYELRVVLRSGKQRKLMTAFAVRRLPVQSIARLLGSSVTYE